MKPLAVIDYETKKIENRPVYPPEPVGVSIILPGKAPKYYAWGHPCENNCTKREAAKVIKDVVKNYRVLYHNAKFDMEVSEQWFSLPMSYFYEFEDSMLLAFLYEPRSRNLKLKQLADKHLDMPPEEQEELRDWIVANVQGAKESNWGEYISEAPGKLVGKYANGDTIRTKKLHDKFIPYIKEHGMMEAYETEKQLVSIIVDMEQQGVPIDYKQLEKDLAQAKKTRTGAEKRFYKRLGKEINMGSPKQKYEAFEEAGLVDEWAYTEKGNPNTGVDDLMACCNDPKLVNDLRIWSKLTKLIGTYMEPWLESALENDGYFYPWFNQIRSDNDKGTKTGRFSSNFQQVPKRPEYADLPYMRNYIIADRRGIILGRDFSQQELRILSHFEQGELYEEYMNNPRLDVHRLIGSLMKKFTGIPYDSKEYRPVVKIVNFLLVYGGGAPALSVKLDTSIEEAREVLQAHKKALPGAVRLSRVMQKHVKQGLPIYTAGGRIYYAEEGFEYKMVNTEIQSSAADHTKRSMIRIHEAFQSLEDTRIMITVHDEFLVSTPTKLKRKAMKIFTEAMEDDDLFNPLPMLSDGKAGKTWGSATEYEV